MTRSLRTMAAALVAMGLFAPFATATPEVPDLSGYAETDQQAGFVEHRPPTQGRGGQNGSGWIDVYRFAVADGTVCEIRFKQTLCGRRDGSLPGIPAYSAGQGHDVRLDFAGPAQIISIGTIDFERDTRQPVNGDLFLGVADHADPVLPWQHKLVVRGKVSEDLPVEWLADRFSYPQSPPTEEQKAQSQQEYDAAWVACGTDGEGMTTCQNSAGHGFVISEDRLTLY